jgi:hypothetical protein
MEDCMRYLFFIIFLVSCSIPGGITEEQGETKIQYIIVDPNYYNPNILVKNIQFDYNKVSPYFCYDFQSIKQIRAKFKFTTDIIENGTLSATYYISYDGINLYDSFTVDSLPTGSFVEKSYLIPSGKIYVKAYTDTHIVWYGDVILENYIISNL